VGRGGAPYSEVLAKVLVDCKNCFKLLKMTCSMLFFSENLIGLTKKADFWTSRCAIFQKRLKKRRVRY